MPNNNKDSSVSGVTRTGDELADTRTISTRRRKLIKASVVAVPAIMTLRSGAAAAAASMHGCIEENATRATYELGSDDNVLGDDILEPAQDEWVRVPGKAGERVIATVNDTEGVYYRVALGSSFAYYDAIGNHVTDSAQIDQIDSGVAIKFYCVNTTIGWECLDEGGNPITPAVPVAVINAGKDVGLLVFVGTTPAGDITGSPTYYPKVYKVVDVNVSPITGSCLASVDPDFNLMV